MDVHNLVNFHNFILKILVEMKVLRMESQYQGQPENSIPNTSYGGITKRH